MAQSPKIFKKNISFSGKKCFSAKLFYGHVECIFDNTAKIDLPEVAKKSRYTQAKKINISFKTINTSFPNFAAGHIECRFLNHAKKLDDKVPKVFCSL